MPLHVVGRGPSPLGTRLDSRLRGNDGQGHAHELRSPDIPRRSLRRRHIGNRSTPGGARVRRRLRPGCGCRHIRRDRGRLLRLGIRRHPLPDIRPHPFDDRRHGGHCDYPCVHPGRGPGRGCHGRYPAGAAGHIQARPLRCLHPVRGYLRVHVRHRHHHHPDSATAVPGRAHLSARAHGRAERIAGRVGRYQRQRRYHRHCQPGHWRILAAPAGQAPPLPPRVIGSGHAAGRAVADGCPGYRANTHGTARTCSLPCRQPNSWSARWNRRLSSPCSVPWTACSPR